MIFWDEIESVRNKIACYEQVEVFEPKEKKWTLEKQREASRLAMRKLYRARRKAGLNAHGKPFAKRANKLRVSLEVRKKIKIENKSRAQHRLQKYVTGY